MSIDTILYYQVNNQSKIAMLDNGRLCEYEQFNIDGVAEGNIYLGKISGKTDLANGKVGYFVDIDGYYLEIITYYGFDYDYAAHYRGAQCVINNITFIFNNIIIIVFTTHFFILILYIIISTTIWAFIFKLFCFSTQT